MNSKVPHYKILVHDNTISIITKYTFEIKNGFQNAGVKRSSVVPAVLETWSIQQKEFGKDFKKPVQVSGITVQIEQSYIRISRNCSRNSCPSSKSKRCSIQTKDVCELQHKQPSGGREKGQRELQPCEPDCRKGKPVLPPRCCLPWEKGVELCPTKGPFKYVFIVSFF